MQLQVSSSCDFSSFQVQLGTSLKFTVGTLMYMEHIIITITSVAPLRGPVEGGTRLTITGTDLGAAFSDIVEVTLQGTSDMICNVAEYESDYIPGTQVVCETEAFSSLGDYVVVVEVNCSSVPVLSSGPTFSVEQPTVSGVSPEFGPVSGGVEVMISGSQLDTGNTEDTRVELNGVECVVREWVMYTYSVVLRR